MKITKILKNIFLIFTFEEKSNAAYNININIPRYLVISLKAWAFLGIILYFLNSAFCIFEGRVPLGKMRDEGAFLRKKSDEILFKNNYCKNQFNKCMHDDNHIFFEAECTENLFKFFNVDGQEISQEVRSEIISEIAKNSIFNVRIYFYSENYKSCYFGLCKPTTEVFINRKW